MIDEFTRECLVLKVARSVTSEDVIDTLAELFLMRGVPRHIRSDNGPEFVANELRRWLEKLRIEALWHAPISLNDEKKTANVADCVMSGLHTTLDGLQAVQKAKTARIFGVSPSKYRDFTLFA
nr:transposase family protein [Thalassoroseus pseudoceratinae]